MRIETEEVAITLSINDHRCCWDFQKLSESMKQEAEHHL